MASVIPSPPLGADAAAGPFGLDGAAAPAGPAETAVERRFRFELAAHPGSPAQARRLTRARLTGWSVCEDTCDTAALVVSELVTNAIVHTASDVVVCELHDGEDLVRIAVRDEGFAPGEPQPSPQRPEEEHGRGLLLIDALCRAWGAQEHGPGLLVWAELPRQAEGPENDGPQGDGPQGDGRPGDDRQDSGQHDGNRQNGDRQNGGRQADGRHWADGRWIDGRRTDGRRADGPQGDLGWGARPKPGPLKGGSGDDEAEALHGPVMMPRERDGERGTP